jgi:hypothetical protein
MHDPAPKPPAAIRLFSFYPPIPAHDPQTGETTGKYVPAHGLIESTRRLGTVVVHTSWQGRPFATLATFDNPPWGTFIFPAITDSDPNPSFTLSFEENGVPVRWSFAYGEPPLPVLTAAETAPDREVRDAGRRPISAFQDDETAWDGRNSPPLMQGEAPASVTLYRAPATADLHQYIADKTRKLGRVAARRVVDILNDPTSYSSFRADCWGADYSVRVVSGARTYDVVFSLDMPCRLIELQPRMQRGLSRAGVVRLQRVIDAAFRR